jgi:hypothetical protein
MVSVGVVDSGGDLAMVPIKLPAGATAVAFTLEPAGGSKQPTANPSAYGALT